MNTRKRFAALTVTALLTTGMALNFSGCSKESPIGPTSQTDQKLTLAKVKDKTITEIDVSTQEVLANYPQKASVTVEWDKVDGCYESAKMEIANGSVFKLKEGSLTPPPGTKDKKPVTLTMEMDFDQEKNELIFTFGPHGSQFSPRAEICLYWQELGINKAKLFYIDDNGDYIQQEPDQMDVKSKKMTLYVDHFSRYALAHSE